MVLILAPDWFFSMGTIEVELYWDHAPRTCTNFAELCRRQYYDSTKFHRIIRNFMIQGIWTSIYMYIFSSKNHTHIQFV